MEIGIEMGIRIGIEIGIYNLARVASSSKFAQVVALLPKAIHNNK